MKREDSFRQISNIKVSEICYKELKVMSVRQEVNLQKIVGDILEDHIKKIIEK